MFSQHLIFMFNNEGCIFINHLKKKPQTNLPKKNVLRRVMTFPPLLSKRVSAYLHAQVWDMRRSTDAACPICLRKYCCEDDHCTLSCGHAIHWTCAMEAGKDLKVCPLCRK